MDDRKTDRVTKNALVKCFLITQSNIDPVSQRPVKCASTSSINMQQRKSCKKAGTDSHVYWFANCKRRMAIPYGLHSWTCCLPRRTVHSRFPLAKAPAVRQASIHELPIPVFYRLRRPFLPRLPSRRSRESSCCVPGKRSQRQCMISSAFPSEGEHYQSQFPLSSPFLLLPCNNFVRLKPA
jgi:hypothetical protein